MITDPDNVDDVTANSSWLFTVKIFVPNLIAHDDPDADPDPPTVAMELISEENGFSGYCDWPEHYQIQTLVPYSKAAWQDTVQTRKMRDHVTFRVLMQRMKERLGESSIDTPELWKVMEEEYAKMTSTLSAVR